MLLPLSIDRLIVVIMMRSLSCSQQFLKKVMEQFTTGLRYIFACMDPRKCMTGFILSRSVHAKTRVASELDCLQIILIICLQNRYHPSTVRTHQLSYDDDNDDDD